MPQLYAARQKPLPILGGCTEMTGWLRKSLYNRARMLLYKFLDSAKKVWQLNWGDGIIVTLENENYIHFRRIAQCLRNLSLKMST